MYGSPLDLTQISQSLLVVCKGVWIRFFISYCFNEKEHDSVKSSKSLCRTIRNTMYRVLLHRFQYGKFFIKTGVPGDIYLSTSLMNISTETNIEREFSALKNVPGVKSDCKAAPTRLTTVSGRNKALSGIYCQTILTVIQLPQYLSGDKSNMTEN